MRLWYGELSLAEVAQREQLCHAAEDAWSRLRRADVSGAVRAIESIDERVSLVVTNESGVPHAELTALELEAWPLARLLLEQAPADLGYALWLGQSALPLPQALADVQASHGVALERATLRAGFGRGHLLELTLGLPGGTGSENEQNAAENLTRKLIGDRLFDTWIGAVHVTPAPRMPSLRVLDVRAPRHNLSVSDLFDTVAAAALGVLRGLSTLPFAKLAESESERVGEAERADASPRGESTRDEWTLLEVEPISNERAGRKDDLLLASTCAPELLRCYLDGSPCASQRFSRAHETFVFVSYVDPERVMERRVARRSELEASLRDCLRGEGAVTGVGLGVETTYVDLALCNLETGLPKIIAKLRDAAVPARTFIQFFDSELADEWVAIWPNSRLEGS